MNLFSERVQFRLRRALTGDPRRVAVTGSREFERIPDMPARTQSNTRTQAKENTHEKVLTAASQLFTAQGYRRTTIREIAAQADVSVGSVMAVGDKQALLVAMFDRALAAIHHDRAPHDPLPTEETAGEDRGARLVYPFFSLFAGQIDLAREYGAILMTGNHQSVLFSDLGDALRAEITQEARDVGLDEATAHAAAKTAYFAYLGTLFAWAASGLEDFTAPRDEFTTALKHIFSK